MWRPDRLQLNQEARFTLRLGEQAVLWSIGCALFVRGNLWERVLGVVLIGVVYARNLEFVHECLHATALKRPRANGIVGTLLALPMLVSFARWRREHMAHHRDVRIEGFRYEYERLKNVREYAMHALMVRHFADAAACVLRGDRRYYPVIVALGAVAGTAVVLHSGLPLLLWFAPLPVAAVVHTHIELPEHFGLPEIAGADPLRNSRITPAGPIVTWFVNGNNYHAIHHRYPRLPARLLPAAYRALPADSIEVTSYAAFFRGFYRSLFVLAKRNVERHVDRSADGGVEPRAAHAERMPV